MKQKNYNKLNDEELEFVNDKVAALLLTSPRSARFLLWIMVSISIVMVGWASFSEIDKVIVGLGKVIPSSQVQVIQNLEGGLIKEILVKEGQLVEKGQPLILIDDTLFRSDFREHEQQVANLSASVLQLTASIDSVQVNNDFEIKDWRQNVTLNYDQLMFPSFLEETQPELALRQKAEYLENLNNIRNQLSVIDQQVIQKQQDLIEIKARVENLRRSYQYAKKELDITKPLADEGIVPRIELLKLQRQANDSRREMTSSKLKIPVLESLIQEFMLKRIEVALQFRSEQQEKLNSTQDQLSSLVKSTVNLEDKVNRTVVYSPVTGKIKTLSINTVGGVIQPGMDIVEIVPTEDALLIEAKIAPKDIAFLRPELPVIVKLTAYDFSKYGGLKGELEHISADTIQDEEGNDFYVVRIRTDKTNLGDKDLPIIPGMTTSVDIITGKRTILEYLMGPILNTKNTTD
ncbi:HlyD family type I secretion periplasmic adaptor subunit [Vibrio alginolyticus]|nr:HlyD family type I secretion periplasmic adaptor subunit [Vibrio alginolyticus]